MDTLVMIGIPSHLLTTLPKVLPLHWEMEFGLMRDVHPKIETTMPMLCNIKMGITIKFTAVNWLPLLPPTNWIRYLLLFQLNWEVIHFANESTSSRISQLFLPAMFSTVCTDPVSGRDRYSPVQQLAQTGLDQRVEVLHWTVLVCTSPD